MALAIDASTPAVAVQTNGNTAALPSASFTPPSSSLILVGWAGNTVDPNNPALPTITDNLGTPLTYHLLDWDSHAYGPNPSGQAAMWWAVVGTSAAMTITVTSGAAAPNRHAAIQPIVITGQDATAPIGTHVRGGSKSATAIAEAYLATATGSWSFLAVGDWTVAGTESAGTGCTQISSGNIGAPDFTYGFYRRSSADGVAGSTTTMAMNVGGTSTDLTWAAVEIVPSGAAATGQAFDNSGSTQMTITDTTVTIDITDATVGAWVYAWIVVGAGTGTVGCTGWTPLLDSSEGTAAHYALLRRQKQSGDTTFAFTWTTSAKGTASWVSYTGLDGTTPDEGAALSTNGVTSRTGVPSPSATPTAATRWAVSFFGARTTTLARKFMAWTPPASTFERVDVNNSASTSSTWCGIEIVDTATPVTAASHSYTGTHTNAESHDGSAILFLIPAAAGTNAPAEAASATGAAQAPTAAVGVNAEAPSAAGTAQDATAAVGANAGAPTATGAAQDANTAAGVNAEAPSASGAAFDATISTGSSVTAPAEAATGTGQAFDATIAVTVAAGSPTASGAAADAGTAVGVQAGQPTATGAAFDTTVAYSGNIPAEAPSGAGVANAATAAVGTNAEAPTGAGAALDGTAAITAVGDTATGAGTAGDPTAAVGVNAAAPDAVGQAFDATVTYSGNIPAEVATAAGQAFDATVQTSGSTSAPAETATAAGTANAAAVSVGANAATANGTGTALDAGTAVAGNAEAPTAVGQAFDATVSTSSSTSANAQSATAAGTALDASAAVAAGAGVAAATGTAYDATVGIYAVGVAVATGQAFDATVQTSSPTPPTTTSRTTVVLAPQRVTVLFGGQRDTATLAPQRDVVILG